MERSEVEQQRGEVDGAGSDWRGEKEQRLKGDGRGGQANERA